MILLCGGGIDSITLLAKMRPSHALFVDYGQRCAKYEKQSCEYFCRKYDCQLISEKVDLCMQTSSLFVGSFENNQKKTNMLGRNMMLVGMLCNAAGSYELSKGLLGYHKELNNNIPDACANAYELFKQCASVYDVELDAPFLNMERGEIFKLANELDKEIMTLAHTCIHPVHGGCNECHKCLLRNNFLNEVSLCAE
jgi:7-cyano-7-deazaguanine synthase in queuosine biosynthesis